MNLLVNYNYLMCDNHQGATCEVRNGSMILTNMEVTSEDQIHYTITNKLSKMYPVGYFQNFVITNVKILMDKKSLDFTTVGY